MTKELVKSENGHKIIKHARHDGTHSLLLSPRIKMGFTAPCLVILLLAVAAAGDTTSATTSPSPVTQQTGADQTTENGKLKPSESTVNSVQENKSTKIGNPGKNDDNDFAPGGDLTIEELMLLDSFIANNADEFGGKGKLNPEVITNKENVNPGDTDRDSNNPIYSNVRTDSEGIRRQGDVKPALKQKKPGVDVQFDDSKQEVTSNPPPRFGQRSRNLKPHNQDGAPILQLTQGGYDRPYKPFRNRYVSRPDSSEQSEKLLQEPAGNSNRQQTMRPIVPQITYTAPRQPPYNSYGPGPMLQSAFDAPERNLLAINHNVPTTTQNGFLNSPSVGFTDYQTTPFQAQFPNNDAGIYPNFGADPNNVALYQASQGNPFQGPLFQGGSQGQDQPILIDPARNVPPQFQQNTFSPFTNFDSIDDNSRPNYASYYRSPAVSPHFQVPSNFYGTNPNGPQTFNNPPISFLSNPLNPDERFPSQFFRYPVATDAQNQRNINDQQPDSEASQEDQKTNVNPQEEARPANNDGSQSVPFGTRLSDQNDADVFIRYPTNEAGYAVEENLPPRNSSEEAKPVDRQSGIPEERNFPNADPYRNTQNSLRPNQRRNNSPEFPPQLFRDAPIDFGYQRPQNQILLQHPDRNIGLSHFPSPDFRSPFDQPSSHENNYLFLNTDNQRRVNQESYKTPACAKQNNASICFEDNEYPRHDILYSLNSNSYIADRLSGPELPLESIGFVEQNTSRSDQISENYACSVDTKSGFPLRTKNMAGAWRIIINLPGRFTQPIRLEVCKSLGDACSYTESGIKTSCVQKYSLQRLLTWSPDRGIYSDIYKLPVACSCQILEKVEV